MKKCVTIFFFSVISITSLKAQTAQDSIKNTIKNLFTAMKHADTALLKSCFTDSALLQTVVSKKGNTTIKTERLADFIQSISSLTTGQADEQITFKSIEIDGALAYVFTPYKFYFNNKFSHCGANNFVLVCINHKWLIQYIIDTRRKDNCN